MLHQNKSQTNFWLDIILFSLLFLAILTGGLLWLFIPSGREQAGFDFLTLSRFSWRQAHNGVAFVLLLGISLHLLLHWQWLECVGARLFSRKLADCSRLNFGVDSLLFMTFAAVVLSGFVMWFGGAGYHGGYQTSFLLGLTRHDWRNIHLWSSLTFLTVFTWHTALHWSWLTCMARRYFLAAEAKAH